jgi:hypothetical protein
VYSLMMGNVLAMLHFLFYLWAWISFLFRGLRVLSLRVISPSFMCYVRFASIETWFASGRT